MQTICSSTELFVKPHIGTTKPQTSEKTKIGYYVSFHNLPPYHFAIFQIPQRYLHTFAAVSTPIGRVGEGLNRPKNK
jgi:hypothetical protein